MTHTNAARLLPLTLLLLVLAISPGCAAVEGIFKAGMWVGVVFTVLIVGGVLFLFSRIRS